jgi:streptomycin 6-kinase
MNSGVLGRIARCRTRFSLEARVTYVAAGSTSRIYSCVTGAHGPAILKLSNSPMRFLREIRGLRLWAPYACVAVVFDADEVEHAILLEPLEPLDLPLEVDGVDGAAVVLAALHAAPVRLARGLAPLERIVRARLASCRDDLSVRRDPRLRRSISNASQIAERLLTSSPSAEHVVLHGDFYPANLMARGSAALAIDPNPCIGDRAFDAATWALDYNRAEDALLRAERLAARCKLDADRVADWMLVIAAATTVSSGRPAPIELRQIDAGSR